MTSRAKTSLLLLLAGLPVCIAADARNEFRSKADVKAGDADYPRESANPVKFVQLTAVMPPWLKVHFNLIYMPALSTGWKADGASCTYISKDGVAATYSVSVPLAMSPDQDQGAQGKSFNGKIAVDRFEPGRCRWEFVEVRYIIDANAEEDFLLFHYDPGAEDFGDNSVQFWGTPVPTDYVTSHPGSKLRKVACQSEMLDNALLLKRAAVIGSGEWGWNTAGVLGGSSVTVLFRDREVPPPPPSFRVY